MNVIFDNEAEPSIMLAVVLKKIDEALRDAMREAAVTLSTDEMVQVVNAARAIIAEHSPFKSEPEGGIVRIAGAVRMTERWREIERLLIAWLRYQNDVRIEDDGDCFMVAEDTGNDWHDINLTSLAKYLADELNPPA